MANTQPVETLEQKIARLEKQNADLQAKLTVKQTLSFKVSEKGALSVYGIQRFPVTLYAAQWQRIFNAEPEFQAFMAKHVATLATK